MDKQKFLGGQRQRRRFRVRKRVKGTGARPRLSVTRSHKNIACQLIDDAAQRTMAAASTMDDELRSGIPFGGNRDAAAAVGKAIAAKALAAGIKEVRFDRGSSRYHGRVAALADAAREAGLSF